MIQIMCLEGCLTSKLLIVESLSLIFMLLKGLVSAQQNCICKQNFLNYKKNIIREHDDLTFNNILVRIVFSVPKTNVRFTY